MSAPIAYTLDLTAREAMALVQLLRRVGGEGPARDTLGDILRTLEDDAHVPVWRCIKWRYPGQPILVDPYPSASLYAFGDITP